MLRYSTTVNTFRRLFLKLRTQTRTMATVERKSELEENYKNVLTEISDLSSESKTPPQLVVVSKYKPVEDIKALYDLGHRHFGENYVQELVSKVEELPKDIHWHFIGALQTNKCKVLAPVKSLWAIETVDTESKCTKLNNGRPDDAEKLNVFIQINTSGEEQKNGLKTVEEVVKMAKHVLDTCPKLSLKGLMTIGSFESSTSQGEENKDFSVLSDFKTKVEQEITNVTLELSMGMSNDYRQAIKQGSSNVRVGSAIFGARKTKEEMKQK